MNNDPTHPDTAAELTVLAAWIDHQLGVEYTDRQAIAETASARIRNIAREAAGSAVIGPDRIGVLANALADAVSHRNPVGRRGMCLDCIDAAPLLCKVHAEDADRADSYLALGRDLGVEL